MNRLRRVVAALFLTALVAVPGFGAETLRIATFNVQDLDFGTSGYASLVDVVKRMNADVVLLQEIGFPSEPGLLPGFASTTGYPHWRVSALSGTMSGNLGLAMLSRYPITADTSWSAKVISGDPLANDITRDIFQVEIAVPEVCAPVGLFTVHLKAGSSSTDKFRRAVEIQRLSKVVQEFVNQNPGAHVFIGGDLNEDVADGPFGQSFNSLPSGLPQSYKLGNDVSFPVVYNPFVHLSILGGLGLGFADATHEDCNNCYATRAASGRRLDYVFARFQTILLGDEVYASPVDDGVDAAPIGFYLRKANAPLPAGASASASDHYPVFADYLLEGCDGSRYGAGYPGQHALGPRAGLKGPAKVPNGSFALRLRYARPSSPAILVLGKSQLNPPFGFTLDPHVPGAFLHVGIADLLGLFNTATDAAGRADFGLPVPNVPGLVGYQLTSQWFVADPAGPNGVGAMSDGYVAVLHS